MIFLKTVVFTFLFIISVQIVQSQVLKNNGAPIVLKPGSSMIINGNGQNSGGTMTIQDSAELRINGSFTVSADTVLFENTSLGIITGDMTVASNAVFYRNRGSLSVFGIIYNSGLLFNLGGTIEIGIP